jgi:hypothetical protein
VDEKPWIITEPRDRGPLDVSAELEAELNRVGVSLRILEVKHRSASGGFPKGLRDDVTP